MGYDIVKCPHPGCKEKIDFSVSGICPQGHNWWDYGEHGRDFPNIVVTKDPMGSMQKEGVIRRKIEGFKSAMVKILKW